MYIKLFILLKFLEILIINKSLKFSLIKLKALNDFDHVLDMFDTLEAN
jgi:hypothetical protein